MIVTPEKTNSYLIRDFLVIGPMLINSISLALCLNNFNIFDVLIITIQPVQ